MYYSYAMPDLEIFKIWKFCTLVRHNHPYNNPLGAETEPPYSGYCVSLTHLLLYTSLFTIKMVVQFI